VARHRPAGAGDLPAFSFVDPDNLWERGEDMLSGATRIRVASSADLIALKRLAGRPQDLADIEALEEIRRRKEGHRD
jgi:hypothetical protein